MSKETSRRQGLEGKERKPMPILLIYPPFSAGQNPPTKSFNIPFSLFKDPLHFKS
jgi:hypothetical protein